MSCFHVNKKNVPVSKSTHVFKVFLAISNYILNSKIAFSKFVHEFKKSPGFHKTIQNFKIFKLSKMCSGFYLKK